MDSIYKMKLHETIHIGDDYEILRVPGGWIYNRFSGSGLSSCFVPFHDEFMASD